MRTPKRAIRASLPPPEASRRNDAMTYSSLVGEVYGSSYSSGKAHDGLAGATEGVLQQASELGLPVRDKHLSRGLKVPSSQVK